MRTEKKQSDRAIRTTHDSQKLDNPLTSGQSEHMSQVLRGIDHHISPNVKLLYWLAEEESKYKSSNDLDWFNYLDTEQ